MDSIHWFLQNGPKLLENHRPENKFISRYCSSIWCKVECVGKCNKTNKTITWQKKIISVHCSSHLFFHFLYLQFTFPLTLYLALPIQMQDVWGNMKVCGHTPSRYEMLDGIFTRASNEGSRRFYNHGECPKLIIIFAQISCPLTMFRPFQHSVLILS